MRLAATQDYRTKRSRLHSQRIIRCLMDAHLSERQVSRLVADVRQQRIKRKELADAYLRSITQPREGEIEE